MEPTNLPADLFRRDDESDDVGFYAHPRLVTHIDDATIEALTQVYRELFWAIADAAEQQVPGEARKRVERLRDLQANVHKPLAAIGTPLDADPDYPVATPHELMCALSDWALSLLEELEVIAPGVAGDVLKQGTKEQRYVLQTAGFYDRLPWTVRW